MRALARPTFIGALAIIALGCAYRLPPDFGLEVNPAAPRVVRGVDTPLTLRLNRLNGFDQAVEVGLVGPPAGVSAAPVRISAGSNTATLQIGVANSLPFGPLELNLRATAGNLDKNILIRLEVVGPTGALDETFAQRGIAAIDFAPLGVVLHGMARQPDGKLVLAGNALRSSVDGTVFEVALARFNPDGSPDTGFDGDGKLVTDPDTSTTRERIGDMVIQSDGKILLGGPFGALAALVRFNPDGSLDPGFGSGGVVKSAPSGAIEAVRLLPDGRILVGGQKAGQFWLARFNPEGSPDPGFGVGGEVVSDVRLASVTDLALQPDGRIVAVGYGRLPSQTGSVAFVVARYNPDGSPDGGFGTGGLSTVRFGDDPNLESAPNAVALQPDGKMLVAGTAQFPTRGVFQFAVARLNPNGSLDTGFGTNGRQTVLGRGRTQAVAVALQRDGKILLGGDDDVTAASDAYLVRLHPDGSPDGGFGADGQLRLDLGSPGDRVGGMLLEANGRIVLGGAAPQRFLVARIWP